MDATFGFVVLHYLTGEMTEQCVEHLLALELAPERRCIVVADNGSGNGSLEYLQRRFANEPTVHVIGLGENLGFARGNNAGYQHLCTLCTPDFVVVLNNDLIIQDRSFAHKVANRYQEAPFGLLGPNVISCATGLQQNPAHHLPMSLDEVTWYKSTNDHELENFDQWWDNRAGKAGVASRRHYTPRTIARGLARRGRAVVRRGRNLARRLMRGGQDPQPAPQPQRHETPASHVILHGSCLVFGPSLLARGYLFNPATFLYAEEDILAYECLRDGIVTCYEPRISVSHFENAATTQIAPSDKERELLKHREKSASLGVLLSEMHADIDAEGQRALTAAPDVTLTPLTAAFAGNAINGAAFRESAITTHYDKTGTAHTFAAYVANAGGFVSVARRNAANGTWSMTCVGQLNVEDTHNAVSLGIDGTGTVHVAWSDHNGALTHLISTEPYGLSFVDERIPGTEDDAIAYPQFFLQPSGNLLLLYRSGRSGAGSVILAQRDIQTETWHHGVVVIDGERSESPYVQACVDRRGRLHLSWTWRQSSDASTNHDIYYAVSADEHCAQFCTGDKRPLSLPLRLGEGELAAQLPCGSSLLNQTSMTIDDAGHPIIASLWREEGVFQHHLLTRNATGWSVLTLPLRATDYVLAGRGAQALPCARPKLLACHEGNTDLLLLMRDCESGGCVELARLSYTNGCAHVVGRWPLTTCDVGAWEPQVDTACWQHEGILRLLVNHELPWADNRHPLPAISPLYLLEADPVALTSAGREETLQRM